VYVMWVQGFSVIALERFAFCVRALLRWGVLRYSVRAFCVIALVRFALGR